MTDVDVVALGADRLAQTLGAASLDLEPAHREAGGAVLGAARIPRVSGRLESTAVVEVDAIGATVTVGGPRAPYAGVVHARNPFLTDALTEAEEDVVEFYLGRVTTALDTIQGA